MLLVLDFCIVRITFLLVLWGFLAAPSARAQAQDQLAAVAASVESLANVFPDIHWKYRVDLGDNVAIVTYVSCGNRWKLELKKLTGTVEELASIGIFDGTQYYLYVRSEDKLYISRDFKFPEMTRGFIAESPLGLLGFLTARRDEAYFGGSQWSQVLNAALWRDKLGGHLRPSGPDNRQIEAKIPDADFKDMSLSVVFDPETLPWPSKIARSRAGKEIANIVMTSTRKVSSPDKSRELVIPEKLVYSFFGPKGVAKFEFQTLEFTGADCAKIDFSIDPSIASKVIDVDAQVGIPTR